MSDDISSGPRGARGELESNRHQQIVLLVHISISGPSEGASWEMMGRGQTTGCQGCFFFFFTTIIIKTPKLSGQLPGEQLGHRAKHSNRNSSIQIHQSLCQTPGGRKGRWGRHCPKDPYLYQSRQVLRLPASTCG